MFLGYVGGRLCEGAFQFWLAHFDISSGTSWTPLTVDYSPAQSESDSTHVWMVD